MVLVDSTTHSSWTRLIVCDLAEIKAVFLDSFKRLNNILEVLEQDLPDLKLIIHFDKFSPEEEAKLAEFKNQIEIYSFEEFLVFYLDFLSIKMFVSFSLIFWLYFKEIGKANPVPTKVRRFF